MGALSFLNALTGTEGVANLVYRTALDGINLAANVEENKEAVGESSIISAMTQIISESYLAGDPIDKGMAMEQAIIEYCIAEMDFCFKQFDQAGDFHNKYVK